jgi:hypothetical protein
VPCPRSAAINYSHAQAQISRQASAISRVTPVSLIDQPVNVILDLGLAPVASHHLVVDLHASIG